jgi:hypothetical protein
MSDILNEAYGILECKECPWYKLCISPMKFTAEDIRRQMEAQNLIASMAAAAQNSLLEGCPVFIERLRSSPKLAQRIKEIVQKWHEEETRG